MTQANSDSPDKTNEKTKPAITPEPIKIMNLSYFTPHKFETRVSFIETIHKTCMILIAPQAFSKIAHYVDIGHQEVGWFGTVQRYGNVFVIQDTQLFEQEVDGSTTEISDDDLGKFVSNLLTTKEGSSFYENMKYWGHKYAA